MAMPEKIELVAYPQFVAIRMSPETYRLEAKNGVSLGEFIFDPGNGEFGWWPNEDRKGYLTEHCLAGI